MWGTGEVYLIKIPYLGLSYVIGLLMRFVCDLGRGEEFYKRTIAGGALSEGRELRIESPFLSAEL